MRSRRWVHTRAPTALRPDRMVLLSFVCEKLTSRASPVHPAFGGPAPGFAGDRGGDLTDVAPSESQRSALQAG